MEVSELYRIFAVHKGGLGKSRYALVKSSLVFVLVEGYRLVALKFLLTIEIVVDKNRIFIDRNILFVENTNNLLN